jgi:hypothetical protein
VRSGDESDFRVSERFQAGDDSSNPTLQKTKGGAPGRSGTHASAGRGKPAEQQVFCSIIESGTCLGLKAALIAGLNLFDLPELTVPVKHHFRLFVVCNPDAHRLKSSWGMIAPGHSLCLGHARSDRHRP